MRKILEWIAEALDDQALQWVYFGLAPLPPVWVVVPAAMLNTMCGIHGVAQPMVHACAIRDYAAGQCTIIAPYSREESPEWLVHHEEKHCAGYNHK